MNKVVLFLVSLVLAILIQFLSMGFLESSIAGNTPILGNILFFIDIGYLIYYMHGEITVGILPLMIARVISIAATAYTVSLLSKFASIYIEESYGYKLFLFGLGVAVNFGYLWLFSSIYLQLAEAWVRVINRLYDVLNMASSLSF